MRFLPFRDRFTISDPDIIGTNQSSALRKYFKEVLSAEWTLRKTPRPRKDNSLPATLSTKDVVKLINSASTYKHQIFLCFVYATGLRLSEATNVALDDIDRERLQIRVRHGKGAKDRYVQVPACLIEVLSEYYRQYKPVKYLFNGYKVGERYCASSGQWRSEWFIYDGTD